MDSTLYPKNHTNNTLTDQSITYSAYLYNNKNGGSALYVKDVFNIMTDPHSINLTKEANFSDGLVCPIRYLTNKTSLT